MLAISRRWNAAICVNVATDTTPRRRRQRYCGVNMMNSRCCALFLHSDKQHTPHTHVNSESTLLLFLPLWGFAGFTPALPNDWTSLSHHPILGAAELSLYKTAVFRDAKWQILAGGYSKKQWQLRVWLRSRAQTPAMLVGPYLMYFPRSMQTRHFFSPALGHESGRVQG